MPWCEPCERFYSPNSAAGGACPTCGSELEAGAVATSAPPAPEGVRTPWHFWLLLAALIVYLGWRLVQGIAWVVG